MLTGQNFGGRDHGRLSAAFHRHQHGQQSHHRLATAHIPLKQPHHGIGLGQILFNGQQTFLLRPGQVVRQVIQKLFFQMTFGRKGAAFFAAILHPHDFQRQLIGQKLIIGHPHTGRAFGQQIGGTFRIMDLRHGVKPYGPALAFYQGFVLPFGQINQPFDGTAHDFGHDLAADACGQGIDRLHRRNFILLIRQQHIIRMAHLQPAVINLHLAADQTTRALWQLPPDIITACVKKYQLNLTCIIMAPYPIRPLAALWRNVMAADGHLYRDNLVIFNIDKRWAGPAINNIHRKMPEKVQNLAPYNFFQQARNTAPHAGQADGIGKKRI